MAPETQQSSDHDLLIKLSTQINDMCIKNEHLRREWNEKLKSIDEKMDRQREACASRMHECSKFFVSGKVFYTALAIIVMFLGTVGTVAFQTSAEMQAHKIWSIEAAKRIDDRIDGINLPYPGQANE